MAYNTPGPVIETGVDEQESRQTGSETGPALDAQQLQSTLHLLVSDAVQYNDELGTDRDDAMKLYMGEKLGNEETGRSAFVFTVVRNTIGMIMPSLMRLFFSAERYVEFAPRRADAIAGAEQATEFISDTVIAEDNPGFMVLHDWFLDALIKKIGVVKWWRDEQYMAQEYEASNLAVEQVIALAQDPEIEVLETSSSGLGYGMFTVSYKQTKDESKVRFAALPPWEFLITRGTTDIHAAPFVGHRVEKTVSELRMMGIADEDIEMYGHRDSSLKDHPERVTQSPTESTEVGPEEAGPRETQKVLYVEGYPLMDVDGEGIATRVRVGMIGPGYHVVTDPEPVDVLPFAVICPHPIPHEVVGLSESDYVGPLQRIMSMIARSMLDSLALTLHPRLGYVEGEVSLEDLLNTEIGAPVRMERPESVHEFAHSFVGKEALPVLQFFDHVVESTTGITKASEGLNAGELQSSTKMAVNATITAAQQHIELIARCFAERGVKELMRGLLREYVAHPPRKRIARIRGEYVEVDPKAWDATMDVRVNVALGGGLVDDQIATLSGAAEAQMKMIELLGPANPLAGLGRLRYTLVKMLKLKGRKDADEFFAPLPLDWQPPPAPPQPSPEMMIAQAEMAKAEAEVAKKQADVAAEQQKNELETLRQSADLQLRREEMVARMQIEQAKLQAELQIKQLELQLQYASETEQAQLKAQIAQQLELIKAETKLQIAEATKGSKEKIIRIQKYDVESGKPSEVSVETSTEG